MLTKLFALFTLLVLSGCTQPQKASEPKNTMDSDAVESDTSGATVDPRIEAAKRIFADNRNINPSIQKSEQKPEQKPEQKTNMQPADPHPNPKALFSDIVKNASKTISQVKPYVPLSVLPPFADLDVFELADGTQLVTVQNTDVIWDLDMAPTFSEVQFFHITKNKTVLKPNFAKGLPQTGIVQAIGHQIELIRDLEKGENQKIAPAKETPVKHEQNKRVKHGKKIRAKHEQRKQDKPKVIHTKLTQLVGHSINAMWALIEHTADMEDSCIYTKTSDLYRYLNGRWQKVDGTRRIVHYFDFLTLYEEGVLYLERDEYEQCITYSGKQGERFRKIVTRGQKKQRQLKLNKEFLKPEMVIDVTSFSNSELLVVGYMRHDNDYPGVNTVIQKIDSKGKNGPTSFLNLPFYEGLFYPTSNDILISDYGEPEQIVNIHYANQKWQMLKDTELITKHSGQQKMIGEKINQKSQEADTVFAKAGLVTAYTEDDEKYFGYKDHNKAWMETYSTLNNRPLINTYLKEVTLVAGPCPDNKHPVTLCLYERRP